MNSSSALLKDAPERTAAPPAPRPRPGPTVLTAAVTGVFVTAFLLRVIDLNSVPGFNADEAWYGVQIQRLQASLPVIVRAPSGRVSSDVFLALVLAPVQLLTGPSIWALRLPAVVAGLLTVALAFTGLRVAWGRTVALSTALILACLPVTIAYSRFGWDPSLLGPLVVMVIAFAGRGAWPAAMAVLAAAVMVHPTAIFLLPLVWGLMLGVDRDRAGEFRPAPLLRWAVPAGASVGLLLLSQLLGGPRQSVGFSAILDRLTHLEEITAFATGLFAVFSGRSVHDYLVSTAEPALGWVVLERVALGVSLVVMITGLVGAIMRRNGRDVGLLLGTGASLSLLYVLSGAAGVTPEQSRYVLYSVPAVVLSFVVALRHTALLVRRGHQWSTWPGRFVRSRSAPIAAVLALSIGLLAVSTAGYLQPLRQRGSTTHEAFLTAPVDPKQQVWDIVSARTGTAPTTVYCADWWICYPLQYFAGTSEKSVRIKSFPIREVHSRSPASAASFAVVRTGSTSDAVITERLRERRSPSGSPRRWFVQDGQGRPAYTVIRF